MGYGYDILSGSCVGGGYIWQSQSSRSDGVASTASNSQMTVGISEGFVKVARVSQEVEVHGRALIIWQGECFSVGIWVLCMNSKSLLE